MFTHYAILLYSIARHGSLFFVPSFYSGVLVSIEVPLIPSFKRDPAQVSVNCRVKCQSTESTVIPTRETCYLNSRKRAHLSNLSLNESIEACGNDVDLMQATFYTATNDVIDEFIPKKSFYPANGNKPIWHVEEFDKYQMGAYSAFVRDVSFRSKSDPRVFWRHINSRRKTKTLPVQMLQMVNRQCLHDFSAQCTDTVQPTSITMTSLPIIVNPLMILPTCQHTNPATVPTHRIIVDK